MPAPRLELTGRRIVFDVEHARQALPYVAKVVQDASEAYRRIQYCRAQLHRRLSGQMCALIIEQREHAIRRLNAAIDDCNAVGSDLINLNDGTVRFCAHIEGRPVSLLWRLGEPVKNAWDDLPFNDFDANQAATAVTA